MINVIRNLFYILTNRKAGPSTMVWIVVGAIATLLLMTLGFILLGKAQNLNDAVLSFYD